MRKDVGSNLLDTVQNTYVNYFFAQTFVALLVFGVVGCERHEPVSSSYQTDGKVSKMAGYHGPQDTPITFKNKSLQQMIEPYVAEARKSYPAARERFLAGLPTGYSFFVTVMLSDSKGHEMGFFHVTRIENSQVTGVLSTKLELVNSFTFGQRYTFPEDEVIDWTITSAGGSEEGNVVGKFLESQNAAR